LYIMKGFVFTTQGTFHSVMFAIIPDSLVRVSRRVESGDLVRLEGKKYPTCVTNHGPVHTLPYGIQNFTPSFTLFKRVLFTFPSQYFYSIGLPRAIQSLEPYISTVQCPIPKTPSQTQWLNDAKLHKTLAQRTTGLSPSKDGGAISLFISHSSKGQGVILGGDLWCEHQIRGLPLPSLAATRRIIVIFFPHCAICC